MKQRFLILCETESLPGPDVYQRLRRLLKCLLRQFGFRCVEVRPADHEEAKQE